MAINNLSFIVSTQFAEVEARCVHVSPMCSFHEIRMNTFVIR